MASWRRDRSVYIVVAKNMSQGSYILVIRIIRLEANGKQIKATCPIKRMLQGVLDCLRSWMDFPATRDSIRS